MAHQRPSLNQVNINQWHARDQAIIRPFIHSFHFYSASSSPLLLRSAPDTARMLCLSFTPKRHKQLRVKDLPKVPTWRLERDSNPRPSSQKASTLPKRHHLPRQHQPMAYQNKASIRSIFRRSIHETERLQSMVRISMK